MASVFCGSYELVSVSGDAKDIWRDNLEGKKKALSTATFRKVYFLKKKTIKVSIKVFIIKTTSILRQTDN